MIYYIIGIIVLVIAFVAKAIYDERKYRAKLLKQVKEQWGQPSNTHFSYDEMEHVAAYYKEHKSTEAIDDITWNDLDMNRVFEEINHTKSAIGQEFLYAMLRNPIAQEKDLEERERVIKLFQKQEKTRTWLQVRLASHKQKSSFSVYEYLENVHSINRENKWYSLIQMVALVAAIALMFVIPSQMVLPLIGIAVFNMVTYFKRKAEMNKFYLLFGYILRLLNFAEDFSKMDMPELEEYQKKLGKIKADFRPFCFGSWLVVTGGQMGGSLLDSIMDYIRMLFHIDIIQFQKMTECVLNHKEELLTLYENVGFLDSMLAVASYREMVTEYSVPELHQSRQREYQVEQLYHPLIEHPVKNSITADKNILLTGSNASGKSTFLKTVAINAVLAQTIHTVLADRYVSSYYRVFSSMALRDDIANEESYYIVEIKSLKRILDQSDKEGTPVLCFIDEVLRGTNTVERIASSSEILKNLATKNALCFAATHDIELTSLLTDRFDNYHFEEQVSKNEVTFDYMLRKGKAMTRNAIKLLDMLGYDNSIIAGAQNKVSHFLDTGLWD